MLMSDGTCNNRRCSRSCYSWWKPASIGTERRGGRRGSTAGNTVVEELTHEHIREESRLEQTLDTSRRMSLDSVQLDTVKRKFKNIGRV